MAKAKVLTLQQKREIAQAAALEEMKRKLVIIREQERLFKEQEAARVAALTPEQKQAEEDALQAQIDRDHQIAIETFNRRHSEPTNRIPHIIHLQDEE